MKEGATYHLKGNLSELVGALEVTNKHMAEMMLLSAIKQTLERDFGAVFDHDETQAPNDGWFEWRGGECPVPIGVSVDVTHRHGKKHLKQSAGCAGLARFWDHTGSGGDIIAYRFSK